MVDCQTQEFGKAPSQPLRRTTSAESALRESTSGQAKRSSRRHSSDPRPKHPHPQPSGLEDLLLTRISEQPGVAEDRDPSPAPTFSSRLSGLAGSARAGMTNLLSRSMRAAPDRLPTTHQASLQSGQRSSGRSREQRRLSGADVSQRRLSGGDHSELNSNAPLQRGPAQTFPQMPRGSGGLSQQAQGVAPPEVAPLTPRAFARTPPRLVEDSSIYEDQGVHGVTTPQRYAASDGALTPQIPGAVENSWGPPAPPSRGDSVESQYRLPPDSPVSPDAASRASSGRRFRSHHSVHGRVGTPESGRGEFRYESGGVMWTGDDGVTETQRRSPHRRNLSSMFRTLSWQSLSSAGSGETHDTSHRGPHR